MTYTIEKVATLIGARRIGTTEHTVRWLLTDSRSLSFPEETLFFALRTGRGDGHRYITQLYERGVRSFVVDKAPTEPQPDAVYLVVPSALAALQRLAERHRDEFNDTPVVGITGSNGKTMVKEWLYQLLIMSSLPGGQVTRSPRSYNSQIGVPLSVWLMNEQTRVALFEAGISQPGEMGKLHDIIQPTVGVLTSLGAAHQENFRSIEEKCIEKLQLMGDTKAVVYCSDDDTVSRCLRNMGYKGKKLAWSHFDQNASMFIESVERTGNRSTVSYVWQEGHYSYELPFIDEPSVNNSITAAVVALYLGLKPGDLAVSMPRLEPVAMRMEVKAGKRGCTIINDAYNNDINSLDQALDFMQRRSTQAPNLNSKPSNHHPAAGRLQPESRKPQTLILSDIFQSGERPERLYREVDRLMISRGVKKFIGIGRQLSAMADVFSTEERYFFPSTEAFLSSGTFQALSDEVVLLKGARQFGFERISELLEQKVHETILEVDLGAVVGNLNYYRSQLAPGTKLVCMVKADAYGAGAIEIAKTLQEHHVDYLAVAVADEGVALRRAGITTNIMVMNPEMTAFKTMFDNDLEPEVYSFRLLDALVHAARKEGITGWPVHIKLDTGMHRLGFNMEDVGMLVERLKEQQAVIPRSVFSHFVGSDSADFDDFSALQFQRFDAASRQLQSAFSHKILRHIDNSAGIEHFPERQLDMCRLGIGLYGVNPLGSGHTTLRTVSTLKTTILQLRRVPAGDSVGYSRRTVLERDSLIAAIPIGYADGLNRHLGNRCGYCMVNGQRAPYVGNICMDVAMVDVTDIDCHEGDTVEIFGGQLPVTAVSNLLDTIPYELLTAVSNRVKRVYFQD